MAFGKAATQHAGREKILDTLHRGSFDVVFHFIEFIGRNAPSLVIARRYLTDGCQTALMRRRQGGVGGWAQQRLGAQNGRQGAKPLVIDRIGVRGVAIEVGA